MNGKSKHTWVIDVIEDGSASVEIDGRVVTPKSAIRRSSAVRGCPLRDDLSKHRPYRRCIQCHEL